MTWRTYRPTLLACLALASFAVSTLAAPTRADAQSVTIAEQLGLRTDAYAQPDDDDTQPLEQLTATRLQLDQHQADAARAQADAEHAEQDRRAAAKLAEERKAQAAAEEAERQRQAAEAEAQRRRTEQAPPAPRRAPDPAPDPAPAPAPRAPAQAGGTYQDYARGKVSAGQFACLDSLWRRESGWNPEAQNHSSTAYGIPQFLNSTWAGTGIAKTPDGYRQIDAGLIYIEQVYGTPCSAWAHSQATGWY